MFTSPFSISIQAKKPFMLDARQNDELDRQRRWRGFCLTFGPARVPARRRETGALPLPLVRSIAIGCARAKAGMYFVN